MERSRTSEEHRAVMALPRPGRRWLPLSRGMGTQHVSRLVFAFAEQAPSVHSLQRAVRLACLLGAELHAVYVSPARAAEPALAASCGRARSWLACALQDARAAGELQMRAGPFVEQVAAHARQLEASLVVTPAATIDGASLTALANAAQLPVLAARHQARGDVIVAATDLLDRSYTVLCTALLLSRNLGAPLVALHNLSPLSVLSAVDLILSVTEGPVRAPLELALRRLERALLHLPGHARPVLADEVDPVDAILREARAGDVDLIAVGTRPQAQIASSPRDRIAARVLEGARCSVLVVPIPR